MTTVKCKNCGAERELSYDQIKTVHLEKRNCPACGIGTEAVVVKEARFQPLAEHIATAKPSGKVPAEIPDTSSSESQESKADEGSGITVGPGGSVTRRRKPANE
jgi:hypothetical protein